MSFTRVLRKHMNKMLIVLAVVIAVTFTVTTTMTDVISRLWRPKWASMFGEEISSVEFQNTKRRILTSRALMGAGRDQKIEDDDVWEYLALISEAQRTGVVVSQRELRDQILNIYKRTKLLQADTQEESWQKRMELARLTQAQFKARLDAVPFDEVEYSKMVKNRYDLNVAQFENVIREILLINNMLNYVKAGTIVTSGKVYDSFIEANHRRKIDYLHLDSEKYVDRIEVSDEEIEKSYKARELDFKVQEQIAFEYIMAVYDDMKGKLPEPAEDELKSFYSRKRGVLFTRERNEEEGVQSPDDLYKPYEEVKSDVEFFFKREAAEKMAKELVTGVAEKANKTEGIELLDVAQLAVEEGLVAGETKPFGANEASFKLEDEFGYCAQAPKMFDAITEPGGKFEGPYNSTKGEFFYRISRHIPAHTKPLEDVREEIVRALKNRKATELARDEAKRIYEKAKEAKAITDDLIVTEKLPRMSTDFFTSSDNEGDIKMMEGADKDVIDATFAIDEVNEFAEPLMVNVAGKAQYYIVQYKARLDPNPIQFLDKRADLLKENEDEVGSELIEDWKKDLLRRADIKKYYLKGESEKPTPEGEKPAGEEQGESETPPAEVPPEEAPPGK